MDITAGKLWRLMTKDKKQILIDNTATDIEPVIENIKYRHAVHCYLADHEYSERFAKAARLNTDKVIELSKIELSVIYQANFNDKK